MERLKAIVKIIPGIPGFYRSYLRPTLRSRPSTTKDIFTDIYAHNKFGGKDSVSGPGSDTQQTRQVISELPKVFRDSNVRTLLDIPCGDFHWMKHVDLSGINYTGSDIVTALIRQNKQEYQRENLNFRRLDLIKDRLPKVDLLFCRDCFVHLSFTDIFLALRNICNTGSTYLLTTTFTSRSSNHDIATGGWRTLNLEAAPFMFPTPLRTINEGCTEGDGAYTDKSLGLWRVADIKETLTRQA